MVICCSFQQYKKMQDRKDLATLSHSGHFFRRESAVASEELFDGN
jgi:hypothetical protein